MENSQYLTTQEVAVALEKSVSAVQLNVQLGRLTPAMKLPGKRGAYLFDRDYIQALVQAGTSDETGISA